MSWPRPVATIQLRFNEPLDPATAQDLQSWDVQQWNYRWTSAYGSKDYSVINPDQEGHDPLEIRSVKLLPDGKTVFLEIPTLRPVMQWELQYSLETPDGQALRSRLHGTINKLAGEFQP